MSQKDTEKSQIDKQLLESKKKQYLIAGVIMIAAGMAGAVFLNVLALLLVFAGVVVLIQRYRFIQLFE